MQAYAAIQCNDLVTVREGMGRRAAGEGVAQWRVNVKGRKVTEWSQVWSDHTRFGGAGLGWGLGGTDLSGWGILRKAVSVQ